MGMDNKVTSSNFCLEDENTKRSFDSKSNAEIFKSFFSNLAENLLIKLPKPSNRFGLDSVVSYYQNRNIGTKVFSFDNVTTEVVMKILNNTKTNKAPGLDNISGIFLKDGAEILCEPITKLCNLSISSCSFPNDCKIAKLKPLFKKG
jgi:hypothetical protein